MKTKDLIAPIVALAVAAAVLLGASAALGSVAEQSETAAQNEIMGYMLARLLHRGAL